MNNKKVIGIVIVFIAIIGGIFAYQKMNNNVYYARVTDNYSAHTQKDKNGKVMGHNYIYHLVGYDQKGRSERLTVQSMAGTKFTTGHYIKVDWSHSKGVKKYERISWNKIPKNAQTKLKQTQ
jgi:uncharacterized protein (TIGR01655 family)